MSDRCKRLYRDGSTCSTMLGTDRLDQWCDPCRVDDAEEALAEVAWYEHRNAVMKLNALLEDAG